MISVNTNYSALYAKRQVDQNNNLLAKSMEKLGSGYRINRAADDASGLAISERMRTRLGGLTQAHQNVKDGISLLQTTEGGLETISDLIQRIRVLAIEAANDSLTLQDRQYVQVEVDALLAEVDRLTTSVEFNTIQPLNMEPVREEEALTGRTRITDTFTSELYNLSAVDGGDAGNQSDGDWSPDGTTITYTSNNDIWVMDADGHNKQQLTFTGSNGWAVWSPDGTKIAFTSWRDGNFEIYSMNADGSNQTNLTNQPGWDHHASWAPDGSKIVFSSDRALNLWEMDPDGSNQALLPTATGHPGGVANVDNEATHSTAGNLLAFSSVKDDPVNPHTVADIWIMNAAGMGDVNLTNTPTVNELGATWSPDDQRIAYNSNADGQDNVYVMNADGTGTEQITREGGGWPDWSPNGQLLSFESDRPGSTGWDIWSNGAGRIENDVALSHSPNPGTLSVTVNSTAVGENPANGYTLNGQTVSFSGAANPQGGDAIQAAYDIGPTELTYQLADIPDPDSLRLWVNGVAVEKDPANGYTLDGQTVTLHGSAVGYGQLSIATEYVRLADAAGLQLHVGAEQGQLLRLGLKINTKTYALGIDGVNVISAAGAESAIAACDTALATASEHRTRIGAEMNRLEKTYGFLRLNTESLSSAESRIRDTDFAGELSRVTQRQVLQQSALAMLAQANVAPQMILQLLP